jgi:hypothetical protein
LVIVTVRGEGSSDVILDDPSQVNESFTEWVDDD